MTTPVGTRVRIVDPKGRRLAGTDLIAKAPADSVPHLGKEGEIVGYNGRSPKILLDDGSVLFGYECWWEPVEEDCCGH
jgi:hypothetical protein